MSADDPRSVTPDDPRPGTPDDPRPGTSAAWPAAAPGGRPAHLQPRLLAVVLAGGVVGTPARYAVGQLLPARTGAFPWGTLAVNLLGAFLLGALLTALAGPGARHPDTGTRRLLRLGLGTGLIGAFTTYSTLAVETDLLVRAHATGTAATYAVVSVVGGVLLAGAGVASGARAAR